jgi:predicted HTH domain antitoxin
MCTIELPDDILQQAGISETEARIELACRLFDTGRLSLFLASKLAGLSQPEFEDILLEKKIPIYRYTEEDLKNDLENLRRAGH